jgi:hypothetical protein
MAMSHVDEGALHAYLDGALDALPASEAARIRQHLASCEACTRRLEEERALREEAGAILAGADPGVGAMPSLEELRQVAAARSRAGPGSRLRQLTWAASVVLAVGAGWLLRGSRDPRVSQALDPILREAAEERAVPAPAVEQAEAPAAAVEEAAGSRTGAAAAVVAEERVAGVVAAPEPARAELADVAEAEQVEPKSAEAALDTLRRTLAAGRGQVAGILGDSSAPRFAPSVAARAVAPSMAVTAEARAGEEESARQARRDLGVISVPGLPVLSVETGRADLPAGTLRVLQLLDGDTLELLHLPAGTDPSALTGPGDAGRTQVAIRYGPGWLLGRAHASTEVLEALLARVTGGT